MISSDNRWILYPEKQELSTKIAKKLNISSSLAQILLNRNIRSLEQASWFLGQSIDSSFNFPIQDLKKAELVVKKILQSNLRVLVYGDYDADGVTSTAIMVSVFKQLGINVEYLIPNRFKHGYGLTKKAFTEIEKFEPDVLITLDCGITNFAEISYLKEKYSLDVMIFDHHEIPDTLPPANVILNPMSLDSDHPLRSLCTVGIVYKFFEYFLTTIDNQILLEKELDLVAIGTVADVANLNDENRVMTRHGLEILSKKDRPGLKALYYELNFKKEVFDARDIGFRIAPPLNAAGRIADASLGVELLLAKNNKDAYALAKKLNSLNLDRKNICLEMYEDALTMISKEESQKIIVLFNEKWHTGVIGIVASRVSEKMKCPTIVIGYDGLNYKGSVRSYGSVNIFEILKKCKQYFLNFGGHTQAAGFSIAYDQISKFKNALFQIAKVEIDDNALKKSIDIDLGVDPKQITLKFAKELSRCEPYGKGNPIPVFYTDQLRPIECKLVGNGEHIKAVLANQDESVIVDAIGFGLKEKFNILKQKRIQIVFNLEINTWQGRSTPQLHLLDIK
tara:strand:- start:93 stop:1784 length:1692 start_codon:yes stop_codon:yes gene_type:complete